MSNRTARKDAGGTPVMPVEVWRLVQHLALSTIIALVVVSACGGLAFGSPLEDLHSGNFEDPESCAKCHPRQYLEWRGSAHAYSLVDPIFIACNRYAQKVTDGKLGKLCLGCHSPLGARTGELSPSFTKVTKLPRTITAGVSCEICHRMEPPADDRPLGNASFGLSHKKLVYGRLHDPASSPAHASVTSDFIGQSTFCGSCHDVLHRGQTLEKTYAEWAQSTYATQRDIRCQDCHMLRYSGRAAVDGPFRETLRRHNFPAVSIPLIPFPNRGYQEEGIKAFLRTAARMAVILPPEAEAGATLPVTVLVKNSGAGHNLPTGLSTFRQMWLEVTVKDADGNVAFRSGHLDANGDLMDHHSELRPDGDPSLVSFSDRFVDENKNEVRFFFEASHIDENSLRPLEERSSLYKIAIPEHLDDQEIRLRVRLLFRSYPPYGLRFLELGHLAEKLPIWVMDSFTGRIRVVSETAPRTEYSFPGDFPTLQAAIDALQDGDKILVAPGEYELERPVDFRGKLIHLKSLAGARETTLRLAKAQAASTDASVVVFRSGEGPGARLEGFTLTGGRGTLVDGFRQGGGIYIFRSSPTIIDNSIVECGASGGVGGGILCDGGRPELTGNTIRSSWADRGGAVAFRSTSEESWILNGNSLEGNVASFGGAVYLERGAKVRIERCLIAGNIARRCGGGVYAADGSQLVVNHCTLVYNEAQGEGEACENAGALRGDADSPPLVTHSILWRSVPGGGAARYEYSLLEHRRKDSPSGKEASTNKYELPSFRDPTGSWEPLRREERSADARAMPLPGRWIGGDYRLLPGSSAIDSGAPDAAPDPDDSRADIGAFFLEQPLNAFVRGDVDGDGAVGWQDLLLLAAHLTQGVAVPCRDAADVDDGGRVNLVDLVSLAVHFLSGHLPPVAPFPDCGLDPTFGEGLTCETKAEPCLDVPE